MAVAVMGEKIRLDRYLAEMGKGSRSQIRQAAKKGRIQVNDQTAGRYRIRSWNISCFISRRM